MTTSPEIVLPKGYKLISGEAYGLRYCSLVAPDGKIIENAYEQGAPSMFAFLSALADRASVADRGVQAVPGEPIDLGPVYVPDDQGPEDVRYVREDRALAAIASAASVAVPGEPVAKIKRGAQTPWGFAGVLVEWLPGLKALKPGEHDVYAASVASLAQTEWISPKDEMPPPMTTVPTLSREKRSTTGWAHSYGCWSDDPDDNSRPDSKMFKARTELWCRLPALPPKPIKGKPSAPATLGGAK